MRRPPMRAWCVLVAACAVALMSLAGCGSDDDAGVAPPAPVRVGDAQPSTQGTWRVTGTMNVARLEHTATLLATGQVLVAGGFGAAASGPVASAELFDPGTGRWTLTGSMNVARRGHAATLLPSGQVLVVAGDASSTAELYDPATGRWTTAAPTAAPHTGGHTATLLAGGQVLVAGGLADGAATAAAELYDPVVGRWTPVGPMLQARANHATIALADGRVMAIGGQTGSGIAGPSTNSAEIFDPVGSQWTATGSLATARSGHSATLLTSGAVVVAGGFQGASDSELYDPASGRWVSAGALPAAYFGQSASLLPDGTLLIAGGCHDAPGCGTPIADAASYRPDTRAWTPAASLDEPRNGHTATLLSAGRVLVSGGFSLRQPGITGSAEVYDPSPGAWTTTGSLARAREMHTATLLLNGQVLVAGGGVDAASTRTATAELYSFDASTGIGAWQATGSMQLPRVEHVATLLPNGLVLVSGGDGLAGVSTELYDPATGQWRRTGDMNAQRFYGHAMTLMPDGRVLVTGNCGDSGPPYSAELYGYDPVAKTGSWQVTASMNTTRCNHTATLLATGQVVVTGGQDPTSNPIASVEVFDPATAKWTTSAPLAAPCSNGSANLLPGGQVMVVCAGSAEVFTWDAKTSTGSWESTGSLNTTRTLYSTTTSLRDGRVMISGGQDEVGNATARAALYDPASGAWTAAGRLDTARQGQTTTLLPDGRLLAAGGLGSDASDVFRTAELYDAGLGVRPAWRPAISFVAPLAVGGALGLQGSLFRGLSEASSGNSLHQSSTAFPVVQLMRIDNGQSSYLPVDPFAGWSDTTFTSLPSGSLAAGPAFVTVYTNGIPSVSTVVVVQPPTAAR